MKFTDISIRALPIPPKGQKDFWDDTVPCFGVRVSQGGSKTFILMKNDSRKAIGRYPTISLSQARAQARRLLAEFTLGKTQPSPIKFGELVDLFFSVQCTPQRNKPRTIYDYRRLLSRHFLSQFGDRDLSEISHRHIAAVLDPLQGTPIEANHAYIVVRALFRFAERRRLLVNNPCQGLTLPHKPVQRSRVLSDQELGELLKHTCVYPFGVIVKLLLLTGQRRSEIGSLKWEYIGDRSISLPASLTKNKREHTFPIGAVCGDVLKRVPVQHSSYLFPARGKPNQAFNGWSKAKRQLDSVCGIPHWTLHDLRRTVSTNLAGFGTPPHVTERLLNHATGTISGMSAIYNRYLYMNEMRDALSQWESKLLKLCPALTNIDGPEG